MSKINKSGKLSAAPDDKSPALGKVVNTLFQKLIENSYDGITLRDKDLNMIYRSRSSERITGWKNVDRSETIMNELVHPDDSDEVDLVLKKVLQHPGQSSTCIFRSKHFDGHYIWLECTYTNMLDERDVNAIVCNFRDITEQKQAEELLHQTITELYAYKYALDESAIVAMADPEGIITYANDNFCKISKYSREELLGQDHRIVNSGYHDKAFIRQLWVTIANGDTWKGEFKNKAKDGSYYWVDATIVPFLDDRGKPYQYIAVRFDITEKKKSEAVLTESEKKYKYLFENNPLPMLIWDFETLQIIDCNVEATLKYGYTREEFLNLTIKDIRPVEDVPLIEKFVRDEFTYGKIHKRIWRHKKKNGEIMFMDVTGHLIDYQGRKVSLALSHDITESVYHTELDKLEKKLLEMTVWSDKSLAENMDIYLRGIEGLHPGMLCSMQELRGQKLYNLVSPNLPKEYLEAIEGVVIGDNAGSCGTSAFLKQKVIVSDIPNDKRWPDYKKIAGRYDLKACWSQPIIDSNGHVIATFACYYREIRTPSEKEENTVQRTVNILQVILESSRRQQALNTSNARFETALEATFDVIWDWDPNTDAVFFSDNFKKLFGYEAGIIHHNYSFYTANVHPDDLYKAIIGPDKVKYGTMTHWAAEYRFKKADGEYAFVRDRAVVMRDENGFGVRVVGALQDITKQKQEERRLRLLESVITHANDSVVITEAEPFDGQGRRILFVNDAFMQMTGYSVDELIGKSPRLLQGPKTDQAELRRLSESLRKWEPCEVTIINYKKNGDEFWVNFSVIPVADEKGWFTHWISVERDVTEQKKNEDTLREAYHEKNTILESIEDAFFAIDKNWIVTYWNKRAEKLLRKPANEMIGKNFRDIYPEADYAEAYQQYRKAIATNSAVRFERHNLVLNGWFDTTVYPNDNGVSVYIKDITDRKKAEIASEELFEERNAILESITDAFFAVDKNWTVTYWNNAAEKVFITSREQILNHNLWEVFSGSVESRSYQVYHEVVETNLAAHFEDYFEPLNRWFEISAYPSVAGLSVYFKDITDRKLSVKLLKDLNANLQKQAKELAVSNAELEQFAYVASHDLQEPLRMVTSFMTQLEKKYGDVVDDKGRQYIHFAVDGAKRMRQIILDLLDFSRVGRTEDDLEDVNFTKMVAEVLALYRRQMEEEKATVTVENMPTLQTYKTPVRQVFQNLVGNGLKYHRLGIAPVIHISCVETETHFQFSVKDNGIGIEPEYFDKVFIIFQRLHNKEEYSGTGMGLAIAKKIVENLGGQIWIESEEGKGATFYFTLLKNIKP